MAPFPLPVGAMIGCSKSNGTNHSFNGSETYVNQTRSNIRRTSRTNKVNRSNSQENFPALAQPRLPAAHRRTGGIGHRLANFAGGLSAADFCLNPFTGTDGAHGVNTQFTLRALHAACWRTG